MRKIAKYPLKPGRNVLPPAPNAHFMQVALDNGTPTIWRYEGVDEDTEYSVDINQYRVIVLLADGDELPIGVECFLQSFKVAKGLWCHAFEGTLQSDEIAPVEAWIPARHTRANPDAPVNLAGLASQPILMANAVQDPERFAPEPAARYRIEEIRHPDGRVERRVHTRPLFPPAAGDTYAMPAGSDDTSRRFGESYGEWYVRRFGVVPPPAQDAPAGRPVNSVASR